MSSDNDATSWSTLCCESIRCPEKICTKRQTECHCESEAYREPIEKLMVSLFWSHCIVCNQHLLHYDKSKQTSCLLPNTIFSQRKDRLCAGWVIIGHHFDTICCSGARTLWETDCDLGRRPAWPGCLHDMDTCCQLSITFAETLCGASVMLRLWCIYCEFGCKMEYKGHVRG